MKSIGISFYILPGFRGGCLCRLGRHEWKCERREVKVWEEYKNEIHWNFIFVFFRIFVRTVCAAWGGRGELVWIKL